MQEFRGADNRSRGREGVRKASSMDTDECTEERTCLGWRSQKAMAPLSSKSWCANNSRVVNWFSEVAGTLISECHTRRIDCRIERMRMQTFNSLQTPSPASLPSFCYNKAAHTGSQDSLSVLPRVDIQWRWNAQLFIKQGIYGYNKRSSLVLLPPSGLFYIGMAKLFRL
jgi:hypothetical protein